MAAPWPLGAIAVRSSLLDSLWLPPEDLVWDSFPVHFGGGFGTHFCSISEAVSGLILELIWSAESIPESSKKVYAETNKERPTESLELFSPTWKASVASFSG